LEILNRKNLENNTILYEAVKSKQHLFVEALLNIPRIDINTRCQAGNTALHAAIDNKDEKMI
jgi:ankyrin repeat protein